MKGFLYFLEFRHSIKEFLLKEEEEGNSSLHLIQYQYHLNTFHSILSNLGKKMNCKYNNQHFLIQQLILLHLIKFFYYFLLLLVIVYIFLHHLKNLRILSRGFNLSLDH